MEIFTLPLGYLQANCYIIKNGNRCLILDPGDEPERVTAFIEGAGLSPEAILLTHGHFDHAGGVKPLARHFGCPVCLSQKDTALPPAITGGDLPEASGYRPFMTLAGLPFSVLETPGHTPGSVCLLFENNLFTGDVLFAGSCGRTDFPLGNPSHMRASLRLLKNLPENYNIYPGHGEPTTLDRERQYNICLR